MNTFRQIRCIHATELALLVAHTVHGQTLLYTDVVEEAAGRVHV